MKSAIRDISALLLVSIVLMLMPRPAVALGTGFIENRGQVSEAVPYYLPDADAAVYFTPQAVVMDLKEHGARPIDERRRGSSASALETRRGCAVYIRFDGGNPAPIITARSRLATQYNFFLGKDPSRWRSEVPAYAELVYHDVWPGIDLVFHQDGAALAYEVVVHPGADAARVVFVYEGAQGAVQPTGAMSERLETAVGTLSHRWSALAGEFRSVAAARMDQVDPDPRPLDNPAALLWGTYLGGESKFDENLALVLDTSGNAVVTGWTTSFDFPTTPGAYDTSWNGGARDAFVAKISSTGSALLWSTFLGGESKGWALALDASGNVIVTGFAGTADFPTTPGAYDTSFDGGDGFVTKLSSDGSALLWSTLLGGSGGDGGYALVLDVSGSVVVAGSTGSPDFPAPPGAYDTSLGGVQDAFVAKLSSSGSALLWSTFLGGSDFDYGSGLALDISGNAVVRGETTSFDFPATPGAYDTSWSGGKSPDVFVAKISSTGSTLVWGTFLGKGGNGDLTGTALALDASGNAVVMGSTSAPDFPTTPGAYDTSYNDGVDVFVAKLSATGSALLWSTFLGGSGQEYGSSLALDASGNAVVVGGTNSRNFPTTQGAYDRSLNESYDATIVKLSSNGSALLWSTFLGGSDLDYCTALALDAAGDAVVTGDVASIDFPTTPGAYDRSQNGGFDSFVAKVRPRRSPGGEYLPSDDFVARAAAPPVQLVSVSANSMGEGAVFRITGVASEPIAVRMFDVIGRRIRSFSQTVASTGTQELTWDGRDEAGARAKAGVYFYQVTIGAETHTGKIVVAR